MQPLWLQIIFSWRSEESYEEVSSCCVQQLNSAPQKVMMHSAWVFQPQDISEMEFKGISEFRRGGLEHLVKEDLGWTHQHDLPFNQTWMELKFESWNQALHCTLEFPDWESIKWLFWPQLRGVLASIRSGFSIPSACFLLLFTICKGCTVV